MALLPPSRSAALKRQAFVWLGLLALAGYGILLGLNSTIAAGGSDSSGYLNSARLLAAGRLETPVRLPPGFLGLDGVAPPKFEPLGFVASADGARLVPTYPTGFPLHLAFASRLLGWEWGPRFVGIAGALAAVWLCFAVGRELGLTRPLAASAAVVLAASPLMLFAATQPLSDLHATTWCLAAIWAALRTRRSRGWAVACGLAYGVAVLVRPTNLLLLPALLVLIGFDARRLALFVFGGAPCGAWLVLYNHTVYGGALNSGYFNWHEFFALHHFRPAASYFIQWLAVFVPTVLLVLPLAAVWRRDTRSRELLALALWFLPITGLYLFVAFSYEAWTCLRYILPALPALILAGMLGVEAFAQSVEYRSAHPLRNVAAVLLAVWAAGVSWHWSRANGVFHIKHHEDAYAAASQAARAQLPAESLVLCCHLSGAVFYYTDFPILRWDALTPPEFAHYAALAERRGVPVAALLFADEEERALRESCPGAWTRIGTVENIGIWRLDAAPALTHAR